MTSVFIMQMLYMFLFFVMEFIGVHSRFCEDIMVKHTKNNTYDNGTGKYDYGVNLEILYLAKAYVVGFRFTQPVDDIEVYVKHKRQQVNSTFWFVTRDKTIGEDVIQFDFEITYKHRFPYVNMLIMNGDVRCDRSRSERSSHVALFEENYCIINFAVDNIFGVILICLVVIVLRSIGNLRRLSKQHWTDRSSILLGMSKKISENNPNLKKVALPDIPQTWKNKSHRKGGTYNDLKTYQCTNPSCHKTYGILLDAMSKVTYEESPEMIQEEEEEEEEEEVNEKNEIEEELDTDIRLREKKYGCYTNDAILESDML